MSLLSKLRRTSGNSCGNTFRRRSLNSLTRIPASPLSWIWRTAAILVIFLLLAANFQSFLLSFAIVLTIPAVITGVVLALWMTGTTLNIQSLMGAIMAIGVAVANAILLVTFAERYRMEGEGASDAAITGAATRLRPILMTTFA